MKNVFLILLLFFCMTASSAVSETAIVEGTIVKYDKKTVTLLKAGGVKVKVPRKAIPKRFKLQTGRRVYAILNGQKLWKSGKKIKSKKDKEQ